MILLLLRVTLGNTNLHADFHLLQLVWTSWLFKTD